MKNKQSLLLEFLKESGPRLHGMLLRLTLDDQVAEELMQELFMRLFEIKHLQRINNLQAYACRMAMNLAFDRQRRKRPFLAIPDDQTDHRIPPVDRRLIQAEECRTILDAAAALSGQIRECFVLHYIEQMDYAEIAGQMQKSQPQIRALCSKAIQRIRRIVNEQDAPSYKEAINE